MCSVKGIAARVDAWLVEHHDEVIGWRRHIHATSRASSPCGQARTSDATLTAPSTVAKTFTTRSAPVASSR